MKLTEEELKQYLAQILAKHNLKIVDCNMYEDGENIPKSFHVPSNIVVSPYWLGRSLTKLIVNDKTKANTEDE